MIRLTRPTFDQHYDGFGIQNDRPRISWRHLMSENCPQGWSQKAYDIQVDDEIFHVDSSESVLVPWPAKSLSSRQRAQVRVRSHGHFDGDKNDKFHQTEWSDWSTVEAGLLVRSDWSASLITTKDSVCADDGSLRPIQFSKSFHLDANSIRKARLYITSHGVFEARLNGMRVDDHVMSPGWTSYHHRLTYEVFDVSECLRCTGDNVLTIEVGAGWFASALGWQGGRRFRYGDKLAVLVQLEIDQGDNLYQMCSDSSWIYSKTCITSSEIYNGEVWDFRSSDEDWQPVALAGFPKAALSNSESPPARVVQTIFAVKIFKSSSGKIVVDFGQNLVGRIRVKQLRKSSGTVVTFRHAEVMERGELGTRPLRTARCTDTVIPGDSELLSWTPKFTFHGFRFVEADGWDENDNPPLNLENLVAEVIHTDFKRTGSFECSHSMLNRLHENTVWSMRGNFLSLPTDCPQRDERLGWTGDIAVFAPSASSLFDITGMLSGWLEDLAAEQAEPGRAGVPPLVVPGVIEKDCAEDSWWPIVPQAIWGDAAVLVPWSLYEASGDVEILKQQFQSMKLWLSEGIQRGSDSLWDEDVWQLGDWLDPTAPPDDPGNARTEGTLVADAYLVHVTRLFEKVMDLLGLEHRLPQKYSHDSLRAAFQEKYVTKQGLVAGDSQTILALAIHFDLLEEHQHARAAARLARRVKTSQFKISTGFAGTPLICHALTESDNAQLAYRVVLNRACPSWMYPIEQGATTIWERWDSMLPNGEVNPGEMTSFNHYALGSVVHWLHECVGGISPLDPGWRRVKVKPIPGATVTHASVSFEGPYGLVRCQWAVKGGKFEMNLVVPPNSRALVFLPQRGDAGVWVLSGRHVFKCQYEQPEWPPRAILPPFWDQSQPEYV